MANSIESCCLCGPQPGIEKGTSIVGRIERAMVTKTGSPQDTEGLLIDRQSRESNNKLASEDLSRRRDHITFVSSGPEMR